MDTLFDIIDSNKDNGVDFQGQFTGEGVHSSHEKFCKILNYLLILSHAQLSPGTNYEIEHLSAEFESAVSEWAMGTEDTLNSATSDRNSKEADKYPESDSDGEERHTDILKLLSKLKIPQGTLQYFPVEVGVWKPQAFTNYQLPTNYQRYLNLNK